MSSGNLRPAAAVLVSVIVTSAGIWYIHKTQTWEREVGPRQPGHSPFVQTSLLLSQNAGQPKRALATLQRIAAASV